MPDPVSDNQTSVGNTTPVENDVLKQLAELKDRFDKMVAVKEKDPVTNFHITEGAGGSNQNQSGNSNTIVGAVNERARREFTDLGRPLSTVLRSCIKNGVLSKLPVDPTKPKERHEIRSPVRGSNLNHIFFIPLAEGEFHSRGKTYPGLEIFMTDYEEKLIRSPEPSLEQLVDGREFMVCMTEASTESERSKQKSEFEDFLGIGDEASKLVQEQKANPVGSSC
ncbi:hypothetical protein JCGZ_19669 [Jatropha curcas]|uniref:Uncharacterized protein n=1 Tax=Jatropha curcas TaxID=180498 RepID=A0A067K1L9_JATCU|nr:hypothetical protein JCGZ_19669 [Jatropha curcas]